MYMCAYCTYIYLLVSIVRIYLLVYVRGVRRSSCKRIYYYYYCVLFILLSPCEILLSVPTIVFRTTYDSSPNETKKKRF